MRYVFIASAGTKSIAIIDLHDLRLAETIALENTPGDIAASDRLDLLVVAYPERRQLGLIDLSSARLSQEYYGLTAAPDQLKLDPAGDRAAVYDRKTQTLEIHNLRRRELLARISDVNTTVPLTFNRDGLSVFWVDTEQGRVYRSDLRGRTAAAQLTHTGAGLSALTRSVDGSLGFVSDARTGKIHVINLVDLALLKAIPVGAGAGRPWGTADGRAMLVPVADSGAVIAISTFTLEPMYTIRAAGKPGAIYSGWLDTTAVAAAAGGDIELINLENRNSIKSLTLHGEPRGGVVSSDSRLLTLPVAGNGDLYILDMKSLSVAERITGLPRDLGDASLAVSNNLCH
jgi:DNA-binding beta-propeller fold protein YncE